MIRRSILLLALLLLAGMFLGTTPAYAHAIIVRSEPADGASLGVAPRQVRLWFSESVALDFTAMDLVDGDGRRIAVQARADASSLAVAVRSGEAAAATLVVVDLPQLTPNVYRLSWRTLSSNDLHNTSGAIVFGVSRPTDNARATAVEPAPSPLEIVLRWLNLGAVAALIGALAIALLVTTDDRRPTNDEENREPESRAEPRELEARAPNSEPRTTDYRLRATSYGLRADDATRDVQRRLLRLVRWAAVMALVAGGGLLLAQALAASDMPGAQLIASIAQIVGGTSYGAWWLLRECALVALVVAGIRSDRAQFSILSSSIFIALTLALIVAQALQSHAVAAGDFSPVRVFADATHLLAAGIWAGGVLALAVAIVPMLRHGAEEATLAWAILRRFGALAAAALAALLISGLFMIGQQVASLDALLTTLYGRTLLIKLALALGVALLGLRHAAALHPRVAAALWRLRPHPSSRGQPRPKGQGVYLHTVRLEALGGLALLLLAAALGATQPARGPEFDPPATAITPSMTTNTDDLVVTFAMKPNQPGRNFISLGVFNTRRPAPAPLDRVTVRLQAPGDIAADALLTAESVGNGRYQIAGGYLNMAGDWRANVMVSRPGMPDTIATFTWAVPPPIPQPRPLLISNRPLASILSLGSIICMLALGVATAAYLGRRRVAAVLDRARATLSAWRLHPLRKE
jgi:copper transport protein